MTQEQLVDALEATGNYRVLHRLTERTTFELDDGAEKKIGLILDVETTGLDTVKDEVIELGMIAFEFGAADGRVYRVLDTFSALRDPGRPISPEITRITGITDELVAGAEIPAVLVAEFAEKAAVVISHKAKFDRRFAERLWDGFAKKAWACSMDEVDWRGEGFQSQALASLLMGCGLFHEGHKAVEDCRGLLEVLARPLPSGETALKRLLDTARKLTIRVWAPDSPFDRKDDLKARGYRWDSGGNGHPKAWWRDMPEAGAAEEIAWLKQEIYRRDREIPTTRIGPFDRHSVRCD